MKNEIMNGKEVDLEVGKNRKSIEISIIFWKVDDFSCPSIRPLNLHPPAIIMKTSSVVENCIRFSLENMTHS